MKQKPYRYIAFNKYFYIPGVKERIRVQVFDENSRMAVYALENSKTTLSCYVEGRMVFNLI